ncbi:MAG TPA: hypothetical protein PLD27_12840 [bacterium]|nr:hypothetical protein [bacterium]HOL48779.1 hypothetical protein [bacterium]HPQ19734.1 hypothetical protein [bacterium]
MNQIYLIEIDLLLAKKGFAEKINDYNWFYLSADYLKYLKLINDKILDVSLKIDFYNDFKKVEEELREEYIEYISSLSEKYDSFEWWVSSIQEKNIFIKNHLFLQLCFLYLVLFYSKKKNKFAVITDDINLLKCLHNNLKDSVLYLNQKTNLFDKLKLFYKTRRRFLFITYSNNVKKKDNIKYDEKENYTGLITWIDKRNFVNDKFKENYFCALFDELKNKENFILLPYFLYTFPKNIAIEKLSNEKFLYYDLFNGKILIIQLLKIFISSFIPPKWLFEKFIFLNYEISILVKSKILEDFVINRKSEYYKYYYSIKNFLKSGIKIKKLIYPFENQPWERVVAFAFKECSSSTELIGYMHTISLPNLISLFCGNYEKEKMPQPDTILTTGKITTNELRKYYKSEKIKEFIALRYEYLFKEKSFESKKENEKYLILIILSIDYEKSLSIIYKSLKAFQKKEKYKIIIKPHPTYILNENVIREILETAGENYDEYQNKFELTEKSIMELLPEIDVALNCESTAGLEAYMMKVPVIEIETENFTTLTRIPDNTEIKIVARTPEQILAKVNEILNWSEERKKSYLQKAEEFVKYCMNSPLNDNKNEIKKIIN